MTTGIICRIWT